MATSRLWLAAILRDEALSVSALVASVRDVVDGYAAVDTGSTDATIASLRASFGDVAGEVVCEPFVDFATTRNRSLDLARAAGAAYALVLSGDETLVGASELRAFLAAQGLAGGSFDVGVRVNDRLFDATRVVRLDGCWRYEGVVHEALVGPPGVAPVRIPGVTVVHAESDPARKHARLYQDLRLLQAARRARPDHARTAFYLAQTLEDLECHAQAYAAYADRVALGGWPEEVYEATYRLGRTALAAGHLWPQAQQHYLDAHALDPRRAEPLYAIAAHWYAAKNLRLAWLFASHAATIPYPAEARLFVQPEIYAWRAADVAAIAGYYAGSAALGELFARQALAGGPAGVPHLARNVRAYEQRRGATTGTEPVPRP